MTFSLSPSGSREFRKSSGRPPKTRKRDGEERPTSRERQRATESNRLTQLLPAEGQAGGVLIQVLVEVNTQVAQLLLDVLDLLLQHS